MKLTAYILNGNPVSDLDQINADEMGGNVPFKLEATVSTGYQDITSVQNLKTHARVLCSDYKCFRSHLIVAAATTGFSNLSAEEKIIASENFCVVKADRDTIHTIEEQVTNGMDFHMQSMESRKARAEAAEVEVYNRIQNALERADLMNDVAALIDVYVKFGLEGSLEDGVEGLFDYLESRVGTSFENTGLLSKTYTVEGMTVAQLSAHLMDILANGNY